MKKMGTVANLSTWQQMGLHAFISQVKNEEEADAAADAPRRMDSATFLAFRQKLAGMDSHLAELQAIVKLTEPVLKISPLLGSDTKYTLSAARPYMHMMLDAARQAGKDGVIPAVASALEASVWTRWAPMSYFDLTDDDGGKIAP